MSACTTRCVPAPPASCSRLTRAGSMVAAVRVVAAGDAMLGQRITRHLIERYVAGPPPRVQPPPVLGTLTDRELEVLRQVASGRSNSEIAAALYIGEGIPGGLGVTG